MGREKRGGKRVGRRDEVREYGGETREESTEERRGKSEEPGGVRNMVVFFILGCVFPLAGSCLLLVRHKAASTRERVSDSKMNVPRHNVRSGSFHAISATRDLHSNASQCWLFSVEYWRTLKLYWY